MQKTAEKNAFKGLEESFETLETPLLKRKVPVEPERQKPQGLMHKFVKNFASNVGGEFAGNFGGVSDDEPDFVPRANMASANGGFFAGLGGGLGGGFANEFSAAPAEHVDVRMSLAERLAGLLPNLSRDRISQIYAYAVQALGTVALDEVLKIRIALSSAIKDYAFTPPKVAAALARDVEREVSEPILRFCASLPDEDLLNILRTHPEEWVAQAIAGRKKVSGRVSAAIIEHDNPNGEGRLALIENDGAVLSDQMLQQIVMQARDFTEWQRPLASRASLPISIAKKLAEFVDSSIWEILYSKNEYDRDEINEIIRICRRRIDFVSDQELNAKPLERRLHHLFKVGRLNADIIADALAMGDKQFVRGAIAYLAKTTMQTVDRIFGARAAKPIIALTWKARLPMRLALLLQQEMGEVPHKQIIYPKGGTDYPLTDDQLQWQVEFFGL